jgi:beta propeller repeat protein
MCLIVSISMASAAQATKIGTGHDPVIYGSKVAWSDDAGSIHIYDLTAKKETKISSSKASYPAIYGNKLVWHDESSNAPRLAVYDIPSGARTYITQNVDQGSIPAIYGNRIVWSANYNDANYNYNVYMRDISTSTQTQIAVGGNPDIYDTKIAYTYSGGDMPRVYVYDVITKKTTTASSSGDSSSPHIYGSKVIWSDFYTRLGHISMYDITTKKTIDVTSANTYSGDPDNPDAGEDTGTHADIYGDKIVYAKSGTDKFGGAGVYVYSISARQSTQVASYANDVYTTPDIYNNIIVWGIANNFGGSVSNNDIYVYDLSAASTKPKATFTANRVSGKAPLSVQFTSTTTGNPTDYYWVFEPSTSSDWNSHHAVTAVHTFKKPGTYTISLTVTNAAGSTTVKKTSYITVK